MKEKSTETISVKIIVTNIQQNSAVVKTVERLSQSNRYFNFLFVYGMERTESTKIRKSENWDDTKKGGKKTDALSTTNYHQFSTWAKISANYENIPCKMEARLHRQAKQHWSDATKWIVDNVTETYKNMRQGVLLTGCQQNTHTHNKAGHLMKK